jgi:hypothetical protein
MTMASSKPLLSIPWAEYETPALGEWSQAGRLTWKTARRQVIRPRKELDPRPWHIEGWIGLRAVQRILELRALLWEDSQALPE